MRVAAIVVTCNRKELLRCCLDCLAEQTVPPDAVYLVDNASTDGTGEMVLLRRQKGLIYSNTGANLGGAGGFARGVRLAASADYDVLWLMDDDTLPEPGALEKLLAAARELKGNYGWLSSRAVDRRGNDQPMNRQRVTPYRDIAGYDLPRVPAVMASFVSLLVPVSVVRRFGLPIADFFIWSDDWEYTRRISRELPCYVISDSRVIHAMKNPGVVNIATDTPERWSRYRCFYRNDVVLYRREGLRGWLWLLAKYLWHTIQVLRDHRGHRAERVRVIWRGFFEGTKFHPDIEYLK